MYYQPKNIIATDNRLVAEALYSLGNTQNNGF